MSKRCVGKWLLFGTSGFVFFVFATAVFFWWDACRSSFSFSKTNICVSDWPVMPSEKLSAVDAVADVNQLMVVLREAYVGYGNNVETKMAETGLSNLVHEMTAKNTFVSPTILAHKMLDAIRSYDNGHLCLSIPAKDSEISNTKYEKVGCALRPRTVFWTDICPSDASSSSERLIPRATVARLVRMTRDGQLRRSPITVFVDEDEGDANAIMSASDGAVRDSLMEAHVVRTSGVSSGEVYSFRDGLVPVLTIGSFASRYRKVLLEHLSDDLAKAAARPVMLIDLRGNRGGDEPLVWHFFAEFGAGLPGDLLTQGVDTETAARGSANSTSYDAWRQPSAFNYVRWFIRLGVWEMCRVSHLINHKPRTRESRVKNWARRQSGLFRIGTGTRRPRLLLLVDNACQSACEHFVYHAKHLDQTVVMGTNTGGRLRSSGGARFRLSNSRMVVVCPTELYRASTPGEFQELEGIGIFPDIWLDAPDTLPVAMKLAERIVTGQVPFDEDVGSKPQLDILLSQDREP